MEIGNQIKILRTRKGVTQEALAETLKVTPQAVSKWERGAATPDISLLPDLSAYFGVTIDVLFALSDDTRVTRIENMLIDERYISPSDAQAAHDFLLDKAKREPENAYSYALLAELENRLAAAHHEQAASYAKLSLERDPNERSAHVQLIEAMNAHCPDLPCATHAELIRYYQSFIKQHPDSWDAYMWLMDQLIDAHRFSEAEQVYTAFTRIDDTFRVPLYRAILWWHEGKKAQAYAAFAQLTQDYPERWNVWDTLADYHAMDGEYDQALQLHRKAWETAKAPRYCDPLISMANIYEIRGEIDKAIACLNEQLTALHDEWHFQEGEAYDEVKREIRRLESIK